MFNRKKQTKYIIRRLAALKGGAASIAAGFACGAAVSFTPFVGLHIVLAIITAWLLRGNIAAAVLGTAVGNPWTFPFIWVSVLYTGRKILGGDAAGAVNIDFKYLFTKSFQALVNFDFNLFFRDVWPILKPMMVGCVPYYIIIWVLAYYSVRTMLDKSKGKMKV